MAAATETEVAPKPPRINLNFIHITGDFEVATVCMQTRALYVIRVSRAHQSLAIIDANQYETTKAMYFTVTEASMAVLANTTHEHYMLACDNNIGSGTVARLTIIANHKDRVYHPQALVLNLQPDLIKDPQRMITLGLNRDYFRRGN